MPGTVQIHGTGQLITLSRRLRTAGGPRLQQNFARRIRRTAEPLHRDLRSTIARLPIRSAGRGGGKRGGPSPTARPFRATLAGAVRISVRTGSSPGARVYIDASLLPPDISLGVLYQLNDGRLRHPVFGNRKRWANQTTAPRWWDRTVARHTPRMRTEVARVLDDVRRQLE
ncbi:hypothetical protein [Streptomyces niveus]|uniref:hypothetical protein n=1 Tax=Streptomyces niveus TaxID=193462 RepID=UPI0033BE7019